MEVQVGFHGVFRLGQPFPLTVELTNIGRSMEGTLEVEVPKGGPSKGVPAYSIFHRKKIFIGTQIHKEFVFTVDPDSVARSLTIRFFRHDKELVTRELDLI